MTTINSFVPPPELVEQWSDIKPMENAVVQNWVKIATQAAQWGSDQELEACCEWLREFHQGKRPGGTENLRRSRRPKPPSLKEQALKALDQLKTGALCSNSVTAESTIRRALEALDD